MAFAEVFDVAYALKFDLKKILGLRLPFRMMNGSKSPLDVLTKATCTTKIRLMITIQTVEDFLPII